jgi:hypothetical protein
MNQVQIPPKTAGETRSITFDFISKLAFGETISTKVVTASVYSGVDASPSSIISGAATSSGTKVYQIVTAGVAGVIYELTATITTSAGQTLTLNGLLAITTGVV